MKSNHSPIIGMAAIILTLSAARTKIATIAFVPAIRVNLLRQYSACSFFCPHQRQLFNIRRRLLCTLPLVDYIRPANKCDITDNHISSNDFVEEVTSFLAADEIPVRQLQPHVIRHVLEQYFDRYQQQSSCLKSLEGVDAFMALLESTVVLAIGHEAGHFLPLVTSNEKSPNKATRSRTDEVATTHSHSFILHICPTLTLDSLHKLYQNHSHKSSISDAVVAYAWLNSLLTDAFHNYNSENGQVDRSSVVHLHQDVWNRSPLIVQSRLRSKCGYYQRRVYARQTNVRRIPKSVYIPFLEENHLWGATGAKYGFGLYMKAKNKDVNNLVDDSCVHEEMLVAVATFSSKKEINRALNKYHSYELLRFCTKINTTVVGGLTKLTTAFIKEIKCKFVENDDDKGNVEIGIDIVTSVDRDFGSSTWPNFERVQMMDPIPMFVGNVDGLRRHAVGAGLVPLEQAGDCASLSKSMILRAGLPKSLLQQLDDSTIKYEERDFHWLTVAQHGFHPVFDAGVERLMFIAEACKTTEMSPSELWSASFPCYVKEHYSINSGVQRMLNCIHSRR